MNYRRDELYRLVKWFHALEDTNPSCLEIKDYGLYFKLMDEIGGSVSGSTNERFIKLINMNTKRIVSKCSAGVDGG